MGQKIASLEIELGMATGAAVAEVSRFGGVVDKVSAQAIRDLDRIDASMQNIGGLDAAAASTVRLAEATARTAIEMAREADRTERAGERMVAQMERQIAVYGLTKAEVRALRAEEAARAADASNQGELAARIRAREAELYAMEYAAVRKVQQATNAAAEDAAMAAEKATQAREQEAQALRSASAAHAMFEARVREGVRAMKEEADAARALAMETHAQEVRSAALAHGMFEAAARRGAQALREEEAAAKAANLEEQAQGARSAALAHAMFEAAARRGAEALREEEAAARALNMETHAQEMRSAAQAHAMFEAAARRGAQAMREEEEAARQAAAAQAAQDASLNSLRSSVDPLYSAQQRLSRELENAVRLYRAGAIGQDEYERSSLALAGQLDEVQRAQARQADGAGDAANKAKLGAGDLTNIFYQVQDIIISLQGGQKPLTVLMQQGAQLQGIMMQTGASVGDMARAIAGIAIVSTPSIAASAALAEAQAAVGTAHTAAGAAGTRAAIAAAELAVAEEAAARAGLHDAAAQMRLAAAQTEAAATAELAAAANAQLALAETAAGDAATAASRSATRAMAPWLAAVVAIAAPLSVAGVAIYRWEQQLSDDSNLKKYAAGLGLTHDEMKKLGDQSVTTGDLLSGLMKTVQEGLGVEIDGKTILDYFYSPDDAKQIQGFVASIYGFFAGGYDAILVLWDSMSSTVTAYVAAMAAAVQKFFAPIVSTAQWAATAVGSIFNTVYQWAAGWVKSIAGFLSPILSAIGQGPAATAVADAGTTLGKTFGDAYAKRVAGFVKGSNAFVDRVGANAVDAAQDRLKKQADALIADRSATKPKVDRHAEQLLRDAAAIEAQIRNLYKLADAYGVSGAAALIAEARVKAESKAIKQRADVEAAVSREIQLAIAQRVSDAAKATAGMRDQVAVQAAVNSLVAGGLAPASKAAEMVKDQIADLTLLNAIEAARTLSGQKGIDAVNRATAAYNDQKAARVALRVEETAAAFALDKAAAADQLATMEAELRLIGATDAARVHELATLKATQEAKARNYDPAQTADYIAGQVAIADAGERNRQVADALNASLGYTADLFDEIDQSAQRSAQGMADAFGSVGAAIGDVFTVMTGYYAEQASLQQAHEAALRKAGTNQAAIDQEQRVHAIRTSTLQISAYGDMAAAAKGFFKEGSDGYKAIAAAEKVYRVAQLAMSLQAMIQNAVETTTAVANAGARATAAGTAGIAEQSKLPFPANIAAMAATGAALVAAGIAVFGGLGGGGKNTLPESNAGTGTVLGDTSAQSESLRRGIDALKEVDLLMLNASRQMASHLRSIDNQIGGFAAQIVRSNNVDASEGVSEGFKKDIIGSVLGSIPLIGGLLGGLFGSKTTVVGSGLYGGAQTVGSILDDGFDASTYSDVQKKKKLFGITTSTKYSTQYGAADAGLEDQFTLILRGFASAIGAAAAPLGEATDAVQARLKGFVVNIGKIDLQGLTGAEIEEKLEAIFGAAADGMADAVYPGIRRFQQAGEGAFETMVRVASTVEAVTASFEMMGRGGLGIDASMALAGLFDSLSDLTNAQQGYFEAYYSEAEQAAARLAQVQGAVGSLGLKLPDTLAGFRALVEAQDLTSEAGRATYATLIQLAPAFADLQAAMGGAKSAADIAAERLDLERKLLELNGDEAAIRALDLAKLDASNRGLQQQVWAAEAAKEAAAKAEELRNAWSSVGDSIMDEVRRIRGISDAQGPAGFAAIQGQFNAANAAARVGDMDAAKSLPALSRTLLEAASQAASSRQELDRVEALTAATLEATYAAVAGFGTSDGAAESATRTAEAMAQAASAATSTASSTAGLVAEVRQLREAIEAKLSDVAASGAATADNTGKMVRKLDDVTPNGDAIAVELAA